MISEPIRTAILRLARDSVTAYFSGNPAKVPGELKGFGKRGVFVTLNMDGKLRGCIGFPLPSYELSEAIIEAAKAAAFYDPRFMPLEEEELARIKIEVSVLSVPEDIKANKPDICSKIVPGQHGLIVKGHGRSGLLLPQVATEYGWDAKTFLEHTCEKAGLPRDAWQDKDTTISSFVAEVFGE